MKKISFFVKAGFYAKSNRSKVKHPDNKTTIIIPLSHSPNPYRLRKCLHTFRALAAVRVQACYNRNAEKRLFLAGFSGPADPVYVHPAVVGATVSAV